jgi:calcineurin-like phosphoesterase family protein
VAEARNQSSVGDVPIKVYLISDTHFNHANIATYCDRPKDFTEILIRNWKNTIKSEDCVIHLGDVFIGKVDGWRQIYPALPGRKILIRGNHDRQRSLTWWMQNGFDAAVDAMEFRNCWLTHEPNGLVNSCTLNVHGHLHNVWHGFLPDGEKSGGIYTMHMAFQRLFAVEYTNYMPVEFDKFIYHPDKYLARGLGAKL